MADDPSQKLRNEKKRSERFGRHIREANKEASAKEMYWEWLEAKRRELSKREFAAVVAGKTLEAMQRGGEERGVQAHLALLLEGTGYWRTQELPRAAMSDRGVALAVADFTAGDGDLAQLQVHLLARIAAAVSQPGADNEALGAGVAADLLASALANNTDKAIEGQLLAARAQCLLRQQRWRHAESHARRAIAAYEAAGAVPPAACRVNLALALVELGRHQEGLAQLRAAEAAGGGGEPRIAAAARRLRDLAQAAELSHAAPSDIPPDQEVWVDAHNLSPWSPELRREMVRVGAAEGVRRRLLGWLAALPGDITAFVDAADDAAATPGVNIEHCQGSVAAAVLHKLEERRVSGGPFPIVVTENPQLRRRAAECGASTVLGSEFISSHLGGMASESQADAARARSEARARGLVTLHGDAEAPVHVLPMGGWPSPKEAGGDEAGRLTRAIERAERRRRHAMRNFADVMHPTGQPLVPMTGEEAEAGDAGEQEGEAAAGVGGEGAAEAGAGATVEASVEGPEDPPAERRIVRRAVPIKLAAAD